MSARLGWSVIIILGVIIVVLAILLWAVPAPQRNQNTSTSPSVSEAFTSENVRVSSPLPNAKVGRTFTVIGEARGSWYFEGVFPIEVAGEGIMAGRLVVAHAQANALRDWTTSDWVPFAASVAVANYTGRATIAFLKDNPSGLPENDDSVEFPIVIQ